MGNPQHVQDVAEQQAIMDDVTRNQPLQMIKQQKLAREPAILSIIIEIKCLFYSNWTI